MEYNAGSPQIEITPAMLDAGFDVLKKSYIADEYLAADKLLVAEIFRAMLRHASSHQDAASPCKAYIRSDVEYGPLDAA